MNSGRWWAAALTLLAAAGARGDDNADKELRAVAAEVGKFLKGRGADAVALGPFASLDRPPGNAGPGVVARLRSELTSAGVKIDADAAFKIGGTYRAGLDKKSKRLMVGLTVVLADNAGKPQVTFERGIFGADEAASLAGATVALSPAADDAEREAAVVKRLEKPAALLAGDRVGPAEGGGYGVEVWVKGDGGRYAPRRPRLDDGQAFVELKRGESYAVRLVNSSAHEAAVTLTIDGLHAMAFCGEAGADGRPLRLPFLVPAGKDALVKGWLRDRRRSEEFLVVGYSDSAAAELRAETGKLGVITATFAAAWNKGSPPSDEPEGKGDATGRGSPFAAPFEVTPRQIGRTRATVSIRYAR